MSRRDSRSDQLQRYVEEVGVAMEALGLPRMWGRVFGALLVADPPEQTAEQLATALQASRGSISQATRFLEQSSLIERVRQPGARKDAFRNRPGAWSALLRRRLEGIDTLAALAERGLELLDRADPEVRRGLREMRDSMAFFAREYPRFVARWERARADDSGG